MTIDMHEGEVAHFKLYDVEECEESAFISQCAVCSILVIAFKGDVADPLCGPHARRDVQRLTVEWLATEARLEALCNKANDAGDTRVHTDLVRAALHHEARDEHPITQGLDEFDVDWGELRAAIARIRALPAKWRDMSEGYSPWTNTANELEAALGHVINSSSEENT